MTQKTRNIARKAASAIAACSCLLSLSAISATTPEPLPEHSRSLFAKLVPAGMLENQSSSQYLGLLRQAKSQGSLLPAEHPLTVRLQNIANRIVPFAIPMNPRGSKWKWQVAVIDSQTLNAFCMPGGKIAFYSGIVERLKLTDDEIAAVMGHEIAHAVQEHARERIGKSVATSAGVAAASALLSGSSNYDLARLALEGSAGLLKLQFSRSDESESDEIGLELAAKAGFDPQAGISLWQKMSAASRGAPPQWLSTHPSGSTRIDDIKKLLPRLMPVYLAARERQASQPAPQRR